MAQHIKNNFMELQHECSEMWNERKGMDHTSNKRQIAQHFKRVQKHLATIKEIVNKIETDDFEVIKNLYLNE